MNSKIFASKLMMIFEDRNIQPPSSMWIEGLFKQIKNISDDALEAGFKRLLSIKQEDWNKQFGYNGKPNLAYWLEVFGKKTEEEKAEELRQYEMRMKIFVGYIVAWLYQPSITPYRYFIEKYRNPENTHLRNIIDKYAKVSEELTDERICRLAEGLKARYEKDKTSLIAKMVAIAKEQNPAPFFGMEKIEQKNNIVKLPVFKSF